MLTIADVRTREDLSSVIDVLMLKEKDLQLYSFVTFLKNTLVAKNQKHEWYDDVNETETITSGTSGSGLLWNSTSATQSLTISSSYISKLKVGDVLKLTPAGSGTEEIVIVKTVNTGANTIDVWARGACGSTAAAQTTTAFTIAKIGNAQGENSDAIADSAAALVAGYNYTQIFESVARISGTLRRSRGIAGDELDRQIIKKLKEQLQLLNSTIVNGGRALDTTNKIGSMGGLQRFLTTTSNVGGALTLAKLYTAVVACVNAGGTPSSIHASALTIGKIEQLFTGSVFLRPDSTRMGLTVKVISMLGLELALYADRHVSDTEAYILDDSRISYGPLDGGEYAGGAFAVYDLLDKDNGKTTAKQVLGEYTLEIRQPTAAGVRAYGIS